MSDINVISRTQRLIIDPPTRSVQVVNGLAQGSVAGAVGVPNLSGLVVRGTVPTNVVGAGSGTPILLDPTDGILEKVGQDLEVASTTQVRVLTEGLYHINAYVRCDANAPAGSFMGLRVNDNALKRHTFATGYGVSSVTLETSAHLKRDDLVSIFVYSTGAAFIMNVVNQTNVDPYSPVLSMWRVSTVTLV